MLVGRGVKHVFRPVGGKYLFHAPCVAYVCDDCGAFEVGIQPFELYAHAVQWRLGLVDEYEL